MNTLLKSPSLEKPLVTGIVVLAAIFFSASAVAEAAPAEAGSLPPDRIPLPPAAAEADPGKNDVVATVNGVEIRRKELRDAADFLMIQPDMVKSTAPAPRELAAKRQALANLIDRELLVLEHQRLKPEVRIPDVDESIKRLLEDSMMPREALVAELAARGMTWDHFQNMHRKALIVGSVRQHVTEGIKAPTPEQKRAYISQHEAELRPGGSVHLHTIAVSQLTGESDVPVDEQRTRQRAVIDEIRKKLSGGSDFAALARSHSQDSKAPEGGNWGTVDRSSLAPELAKLAFSIPLGSPSEAFEFRGYYYMLKVEERGAGELPPQEQLDQLVTTRLEAEFKHQAMEAFLAKLRKKAKITYADRILRPE
ncbi:MAG: peptidylprolyl isomerase [Verrucomicrobiales bacterium]